MILRILFFAAFLTCLASWTIHHWQPEIDWVEYGVVNPNKAPTRLFETADSSSQVVAHLENGGFAKLLYSGKSGKWLYVEYVDRQLSVYHKRVEEGFLRLGGKWIWSLKDMEKTTNISGLFSLLFFVLLIVRKRSVNEEAVVELDSNHEIKLVNPPPLIDISSEHEQRIPVVLQPLVESDQMKTELEKKVQELEEKNAREAQDKEKIREESEKRLAEEKRKSHSLAQQNQHLQKTLKTEKGKADQLKQVASIALDEHKKVSKQLAQQKQDQQKQDCDLDKRLEEEAKRRYASNIEAMNQSYNELVQIHQQDLRNAEVFDVNLRHPKLENIIKGRLFEQCIAKCMQDILGFRILEWTPDKGFLSGIDVKSNKNPDLLLEGPQGQKIAIECKYRKEFFTGAGEETLAWSRMYRAYDYKRYGEERGATVYMALGIDGDSSCPNHVYLVPLSRIMARGFSFRADIKNKQFGDSSTPKSHFSAPKNLLENWRIDLAKAGSVAEVLCRGGS